jgi:hypothetical protein
VTIVAADSIGSLVIEKGVSPVDSSGEPLSRIFLSTLEPGSIPSKTSCASTPYTYEIIPPGATFTPAVALILTFDEITWAGLNGNTASIIWYNSSSGLWENTTTETDSGSRTVKAMITRGGIYALCLITGPQTPPTTGPAVPPTSPGSSGLSSEIIIPAILLIIVIVGVIGYLISTRTFKEGPPPEGGQ